MCVFREERESNRKDGIGQYAVPTSLKLGPERHPRILAEMWRSPESTQV